MNRTDRDHTLIVNALSVYAESYEQCAENYAAEGNGSCGGEMRAAAAECRKLRNRMLHEERVDPAQRDNLRRMRREFLLKEAPAFMRETNSALIRRGFEYNREADDASLAPSAVEACSRLWALIYPEEEAELERLEKSK